MDILNKRGDALSPNAAKNILAAMDELKSVRRLCLVADDARIYWMTGDYTFDEKAAALLDEAGKRYSGQGVNEFKKLNDFTATGIENMCKAFAEANGLKLGKVMMPLRAALTGTTSSPSLFHAIEIWEWMKS